MSREGTDVPQRAGLRLRCELRAWRYRRSVRCAYRRQDRHERSPERLRFLARRQSFAVLESERVLSHFGGTTTSNARVAISYLCCLTCSRTAELVGAADHDHEPVPVHRAVRRGGRKG